MAFATPQGSRSRGSAGASPAEPDTPGSGSSSKDGQYNKYAMAIPFPPSTDNDDKDAEARGHTWQLREIVHKCMEDHSHTMDFHGRLRERELAKCRLYNSITGDDSFQGVKTLQQLPTDFIRAFVSNRSNKPITDIRIIDSLDPQGSLKMMSLETQLPHSLALPKECVSKEVCLRWMAFLGDRHGCRLLTFSADGGINADGSLDWTKGCYRPQWSVANTLCGATHISGITLRVGHNIARLGTKVDKNYLDGVAMFVVPLFEGKSMISWWGSSKKIGPHKHKIVVKKSQDIEQEALDIAKRITTERATTTVQSSIVSVAELAARMHILEDKRAEAKKRGAKAREAAAKSAAKKRTTSEAAL